jgi:Tol biopolymer transport system component
VKRLLVVISLALLAGGCGGGPSGPTEIAFVSTRDGDYAIFGMTRDGKGEHRLTDEKGDPSTPQGLYFQDDPAWNPDGTSIAFTSRREGASHVFVMQADGTGTRRITSGEDNDSHPSWSPGGADLAFSRGSPADLYVVSERTGRVRRIGSDGADERYPAWSPDGRWIAYTRRTPGTSSQEIWLIRPDGTGKHQLTRLQAVSVSPAWSPDGKRIAFSTDVDRSFDIYTVNADGSDVQNATTGAPDDFEPAWSPDGRIIAFMRDGAITVLRPDGTETALSSGENDSLPAWRPRVPPESR